MRAISKCVALGKVDKASVSFRGILALGPNAQDGHAYSMQTLDHLKLNELLHKFTSAGKPPTCSFTVNMATYPK